MDKPFSLSTTFIYNVYTQHSENEDHGIMWRKAGETNDTQTKGGQCVKEEIVNSVGCCCKFK